MATGFSSSSVNRGTDAPLVSVLLPTWNGAADLRRLLPALASQELPSGFEVCAVDSSSSDETAELLRAAGVQLKVIPQAQFRHGPTRNLCAEMASGKFLVFLSQDAEPSSPDFLASLVQAFDDPQLAGVYARCLPRDQDDPLTRRTALSAPEAQLEPQIQKAERPWRELSLNRQIELARFNNVASAIRADVFRELPFPDVSFGEDIAWAATALQAGHSIGYQPAASVYHAHTYGPAEALKRYRTDADFHRRVNGWRVRPGLGSMLRGVAFEVREDWRFLGREGASRLRWLPRSFALRAAQVWGQYLGSRGELGAGSTSGELGVGA